MANTNIIEKIGETCCNCLKTGIVTHIVIRELGYGSKFDCNSTAVDLCECCLSKTNPKWWEFNVQDWYEKDVYCGQKYEYEDEIFDFVNTMPLAGQELFYNTYSDNAWKISQKNWVENVIKLNPSGSWYIPIGHNEPKRPLCLTKEADLLIKNIFR